MITKFSKVKISCVLFSLMLIQILASCRKDDTPSISSKKIVYKVEASTDASIKMVVYGFDTDLTSISNANVQTWTSPEITISSNYNVATITANAMGTNATSTLKVKIFIDGVEKKVNTSTGTALSATAQYNLR
jgi:hypothetical protein